MRPKSIWHQFKSLIKSRKTPDAFLKHVGGVVHVGANTGQEREQYASLGLRVLWIEPIPDIFKRLEANIASYPRQTAVQALITDVDGKLYDFHVANNDAASSSILALDRHKELWPTVSYTSSMSLRSTTLPRLFEELRLNPLLYEALVLDTQGSELLVLRGASSLLKYFEYVKTEVPDFEAYSGCCVLSEMDDFLGRLGFQEVSRRKFASLEGVGAYYDVIYQRQRS